MKLNQGHAPKAQSWLFMSIFGHVRGAPKAARTFGRENYGLFPRETTTHNLALQNSRPGLSVSMLISRLDCLGWAMPQLFHYVTFSRPCSMTYIRAN